MAYFSTKLFEHRKDSRASFYYDESSNLRIIIVQVSKIFQNQVLTQFGLDPKYWSALIQNDYLLSY